MIFRMFQNNTGPALARRRTKAPRYHLALEGLEERTVMSAAAVAHVVQQPAVQVAPKAAAAVSLSAPIQITGITVNRTLQRGQNVAAAVATVTGTIAGQAFRTLGVLTGSAGATTPTQVLNLHLAPIDLNVLGLEVKTSSICLNISAQPGNGNLLGNLVAGVAGALNGTQGGNGLLGTLNGLLGTVGGGTARNVNGALSTLLSTVTTSAGSGSATSSVVGLLNTALGSMTASAPTAAQNILHLAVGPLNLNLLGLIVTLDNCQTPAGPVTVDINAIPGKGNLLGNLLVGLSHALDPSLLSSFDQALLTAIGNLKL